MSTEHNKKTIEVAYVIYNTEKMDNNNTKGVIVFVPALVQAYLRGHERAVAEAKARFFFALPSGVTQQRSTQSYNSETLHKIVNHIQERYQSLYLQYKVLPPVIKQSWVRSYISGDAVPLESTHIYSANINIANYQPGPCEHWIQNIFLWPLVCFCAFTPVLEIVLDLLSGGTNTLILAFFSLVMLTVYCLIHKEELSDMVGKRIACTADAYLTYSKKVGDSLSFSSIFCGSLTFFSSLFLGYRSGRFAHQSVINLFKNFRHLAPTLWIGFVPAFFSQGIALVFALLSGMIVTMGCGSILVDTFGLSIFQTRFILTQQDHVPTVDLMDTEKAQVIPEHGTPSPPSSFLSLVNKFFNFNFSKGQNNGFPPDSPRPARSTP